MDNKDNGTKTTKDEETNIAGHSEAEEISLRDSNDNNNSNNEKEDNDQNVSDDGDLKYNHFLNILYCVPKHI